MKRICIYCGSSSGHDLCYLKAAGNLGRIIAEREIELVYGGAEIGLMGHLANTILNAGGSVIGIIPKSFAHKVSHKNLTKLHVVDSMHERKTMMFDLSDAFIAMPGGFGTLEEILEVLTWGQLSFHKKPCGLLNVNGYFNLLLSFLENAVSEGFVKKAHKEMLLISDNPAELLKKMDSYTAPGIEKWKKDI